MRRTECHHPVAPLMSARLTVIPPTAPKRMPSPPVAAVLAVRGPVAHDNVLDQRRQRRRRCRRRRWRRRGSPRTRSWSTAELPADGHVGRRADADVALAADAVVQVREIDVDRLLMPVSPGAAVPSSRMPTSPAVPVPCRNRSCTVAPLAAMVTAGLAALTIDVAPTAVDRSGRQHR